MLPKKAQEAELKVSLARRIVVTNRIRQLKPKKGQRRVVWASERSNSVIKLKEGTGKVLRVKKTPSSIHREIVLLQKIASSSFSFKIKIMQRLIKFSHNYFKEVRFFHILILRQINHRLWSYLLIPIHFSKIKTSRWSKSLFLNSKISIRPSISKLNSKVEVSMCERTMAIGGRVTLLLIPFTLKSIWIRILLSIKTLSLTILTYIIPKNTLNFLISQSF